MKRTVLTILLVALLAPSALAALKINDAAPAFSLPGAGQRNFSFGAGPGAQSSEKGKAYVLSFFATWCPACREELPILDSLVDELSARGITVVLIGVREDFEEIGDLLNELKVKKPLVLNDQKGTVAEKYQVRFLPTTFFIGSDGKVKDIIFGGIDDRAELKKSSEKLLK
ncbi:MAG: hypothetical protein A2010_05675 [Nitrospirae bacterium GWD2_57_9]|nr:MAG: hypothetical protein A2010_05675 [Nitrospirae bacterium GWD2_57_9]